MIYFFILKLSVEYYLFSRPSIWRQVC